MLELPKYVGISLELVPVEVISDVAGVALLLLLLHFHELILGVDRVVPLVGVDDDKLVESIIGGSVFELEVELVSGGGSWEPGEVDWGVGFGTGVDSGIVVELSSLGVVCGRPDEEGGPRLCVELTAVEIDVVLPPTHWLAGRASAINYKVPRSLESRAHVIRSRIERRIGRHPAGH